MGSNIVFRHKATFDRIVRHPISRRQQKSSSASGPWRLRDCDLMLLHDKSAATAEASRAGPVFTLLSLFLKNRSKLCLARPSFKGLAKTQGASLIQ